MSEMNLKGMRPLPPLKTDTSMMEGRAMAKFDVDFDQFAALMGAVLPLCAVAKSELTDTVYRGFGSDGLWLVKQEI